MNLHVTRATDANNGKQNPTHNLTPSQSHIQPKGNPPPKSHPHKAKPLQRLRVKLTF